MTETKIKFIGTLQLLLKRKITPEQTLKTIKTNHQEDVPPDLFHKNEGYILELLQTMYSDDDTIQFPADFINEIEKLKTFRDKPN